MIEVKEVNFAYRRGEPVIHDISCTIDKGEFVALLGHNGSGKTTLSRLFMALLHPRSGVVEVNGEDVAKYEPADLAGEVGYVFQNPDLQILEDTVYDEVAYGLRIKKLSERVVKERVMAALTAMGMEEMGQAYPRTLSFGQKRRLGVAAALALHPSVLILDEITNGQDHTEKEEMLRYLQNINQQQGITIILITHDMGIAYHYTNRALVLHRGALAYDGATKKLFDGQYDLAHWGLKQPLLPYLNQMLGITAGNLVEFCHSLKKAGDRL